MCIRDSISGEGQTRAAHKLCTGIPEAKRQHFTVPGAGHYGIFSGRRWRTQVYPRVRDFIAAANAKTPASATKNTSAPAATRKPKATGKTTRTS